jgi:hypothetical protein
VNGLTMKINKGVVGWVGTTLNHPITLGIYKLYFYFYFYFVFYFYFYFILFYFILFFFYLINRKLKFTSVNITKCNVSFFYLIFFFYYKL